MFLVGGASAALSPTIQTRLMDVARDSQSIAAALNHSALNIGNSLGALLGGFAIAAGLGYVAPIWIGLVLSSPGIAARRDLVRARPRARATRHRGAVRDGRGAVVDDLAGRETAGSVGLQQDAVLDGALSQRDLRADVEAGERGTSRGCA